MRTAYLVNQYPMVSLSFIRREIAALEERGVEVRRYAIRRWEGPLVDAADQAEAAKTHWILESGAPALFAALVATAFGHPIRFFRACRLACRTMWRSDRAWYVHAGYVVEACVLLRWTARDRIDHLHAHFASNPAELAMLCREMGGPPYSFMVHGPEDFDRAAQLSLDLKIGRARFVAAITDYCRSQLFRWSSHADWGKIRIVRCGLDRDYLDRPATPPRPGGPFVCVGRLCGQKGQLLLVEAAAALKQRGRPFKIVLVGDGELRAPIEALIHEYGLSDEVSITGWATAKEVQEHLEGCRALVLPSFAEGLPVVIMEALAMERPVVSTYIAGIPELVAPGRNGWLCPAGSVDALVDTMMEVLDASPETLAALGRNGRVDVAERHDVSKEAEKLIQLMSSR